MKLPNIQVGKLILAAMVMGGAAANVSASVDLNVILDEWGNGYIGTFDITTSAQTLQSLAYSTSIADPLNLGGPLTLSYALPSGLVPTTGDFVLVDPDGSQSDVIRIETSRIYVYSDIDGVPVSLADVGVPANLQANQHEITLGALKPSGVSIDLPANGFTTSLSSASQIGFMTGSIPINGVATPIDGVVNYYIVSDGVVPEPTTMLAGALLLFPFGASTLRFLRRNRAA